MEENFIDKLVITAINHMSTNKWEWPKTWDKFKKKQFLHQCLAYAEQNEYYEQCAIIRDVEKTIIK